MSRLQHTPESRSRLAAVIFMGLCLAAVLFMIVMCSGCSSLPTSDFHARHRMTIDVHVVGNQDQFDYEPYRHRIYGGYAKTGSNEIWIVGEMVDGKVKVKEPRDLGHEVEELLHYGNPQLFERPHRK